MDPLFHLAHFAAQAAAFCAALLILCFFLYRSLVHAGLPTPITPPPTAFEGERVIVRRDHHSHTGGMACTAPNVSPTTQEWRAIFRGVTPEFSLPSLVPNDSPASSQDTKVASMGSHNFPSGHHLKPGSDIAVIKAPTIRKAEFMKRRLSASLMAKTQSGDKEDSSLDRLPLAQGLLRVSNGTRPGRDGDMLCDMQRPDGLDGRKIPKRPTLSTVDWTNRQSALAFMSVYDSPNDHRRRHNVSTPSDEMDDFFVYRSSEDFIPTYSSTPPNLRSDTKQSSAMASAANSPDFLASPFCARSFANGHREDERVQSYFKFNLAQSLGMSAIAESMGRLPGDLAASFIVAYHNKRRDEEFRAMYGSF